MSEGEAFDPVKIEKLDGERVSKALIEFAPKSLRTIKFSKDDI